MISKLGRAACSILTLGCVCLLGFSIPWGWPWEWNLCLELTEPLSSSPKFDESTMLLLMGDWFGCGCRALRTGNECSFEGGAGGNSGSEIFEFSPNGPSGPRESSMASRRVACAPTFRDVRGFLPAGDLGVEEAERVEEEVGLALSSDSAVL